MASNDPAAHSPSNRIIWWLCLFVVPLILIGIELFHPAGFTHSPGMFAYLSGPQPAEPQHKALGYFGPEWWFLLHMIQTPLVGMVCIGLWLMLGQIGRQQGVAAASTAWLARLTVFIMLIYFTALDSIGGFGLARYIIVAKEFAALPAGAPNHVSADQMKGIVTLLNAVWLDPWVGGQQSFVSQTASWASFVAAVLIAASLLLARMAPLIPLLLLVVFGWILQLSHTAFHGPIAFGLLTIAAFWMRLRPRPGLI